MARKTYHHGDLRNAMIEAALRLVESKGLRGFSMREAAREAGVAPSAPYRHFKDKTALMTAVAEVALTMLNDFTREEVEKAEDSPLFRFRATGVAYVLFAATYPSHFRVLHDPEYADRTRSELLASHFEYSERLMHEHLNGAQDRGEILASPAIIELTASTLMYGLARRIVDNQFNPTLTLEEVRELAMQMTYMLGTGFTSFQPSWDR